MMSDTRKKMQSRLRRRFGYSTNTNYGRGAILWKDNKFGSSDEVGICLENRTYGPEIPYQLEILVHDFGDRQSKCVAAFTKEEALLLCKVIEEFFREREKEAAL